MSNGRRGNVAILLVAALSIPSTAQAETGPERTPNPCPSRALSPTPTDTPTPPSPLPTESPSPTPSPSPTEAEECPTPTPSPKAKPKPTPSTDDPDKPKDGDDEELEDPEYPRLLGAYNTDVLIAVAGQLRALGWSADKIVPVVYAPFIIGGEANWIDTWGAPRFGPGPIVRTHEGQDVFCDYGDPILASQGGVVDYGDGGLGGVVARLHRPDGGYWYYAHLSATNEEAIPAGSSVEHGDVIGFCGNSGNAIATPPHVHFGFYSASGEARNPMRALIRWLREARVNAFDVLARVQGKRVAQIYSLTTARMFGESVAPVVTDVNVNVHTVAVAEEWAALHLVKELLPVTGVAGNAVPNGEASRPKTRAAHSEKAN